MSKKSNQASKCITNDCGNSVYSRGLCCTCYATFRRALKRGEVTEEKAVKLGAVLESQPHGRTPGTSKWHAAFKLGPVHGK